MNLMVMDLILNSFCNSLSIISSTDGKLLIMQLDNKDTEFVKNKTFISPKTNISQYTKEDTTRSSAQIIMTNTGCNPFFQYKG
ncbi:hypothetical protein T4A_5343 [Trichinella pseudospiralis]|uniref:Uncharacterized protein n=1 Tax=Trichinella pseudospiralis TaxID=6337 RepID=A0A0V1DXF2_TRIPS|nr:hypothetical protein T4A_5343 [Trichinella pseudospiralis]